MMEEHNEIFSFTYSAGEQEELKKIRQKYIPPEEDKMELIRRLDRGVSEKGAMVSVIVGVIGALILGVGMCCTMVWQGLWFIPGILVGLVGIIVLAAAYPIYCRVIQQEREKVAPEILRLTDELLK